MALAGFQIINKILQNKDISIVIKNGLDESYFNGFEDEFNFIIEHYKKFGNVPDNLSFLEKFQNFTITEVLETDEFLLDKLDEEVGYQKFVKFFPLLSKKVQEDSREGYDFLKDNLENLKVRHKIISTDIIANSQQRYDEYIDKSNNKDKNYIKTGLEHLDNIISGISCNNELITIVARTSNCKSLFLEKMLYGAWIHGKRVGLYSGEMGTFEIGARFDAINNHIPYSAVMNGHALNNYQSYITELGKNKTPFFVATQKNFNGKPTVRNIRNYIEQNNIEIMGIDQLSLMEDCRENKNDPQRIKYGHITEDLFCLSTELQIPILLAVQANREAVKRSKNLPPEIEDISESDTISHNSSKILSLSKNKDELLIKVLKNRNGVSGNILKYYLDVNNGYFDYISSDDDGQDMHIKQEIIQKQKDEMNKATTKCPF